MPTEPDPIEKQLEIVRATMLECLHGTNLAKLLPSESCLLGSGKLLRSRLALRIGNANGIDERVLIHAAAAVETIHVASLLHDDVIDGGLLRRGAPTFWKKHGTNGAILFGDLLVVKGLALLAEVRRQDLLEELVDLSTLVCISEVEQELVLRETMGTWEECEAIARAKTGSLFAFAAIAGGDGSNEQADALREAGFLLGTAYQLADDVLDASGNDTLAGKTLGTDGRRKKTTAKTAIGNAPVHPAQRIRTLLDSSAEQLERWPVLSETWSDYLATTMQPVLDKHLSTR